MSTNAIIAKLNDILKHEWTGVAQYAQAGFLISGLWREVYSKMFFDSAKESFKHAQTIGEKITALGGTPTVERNTIRQSSDLEEMLQIGLAFEQKAVALYTEALEVAAEDRALVVLLEDILLEEQEGVDHLTQVLRTNSAAASKSAKPSKASKTA